MTSVADAVSTPASIPNELNYSEPIHSIPPGYRSVNFRQVNYNTIPSPTPGGTEIQINIPQVPSAFIDTSTTYLNVKVRCEFNHQSKFSTALEYTRLDGEDVAFVVDQLIENWCNANGWGLFQRYQLYANNSILIEDIDEIGYLVNMLGPMTSSIANNTLADIDGDSKDLIYPGHRFLIRYQKLVIFLRIGTKTGSAISAAADNNLSTSPLIQQALNVAFWGTNTSADYKDQDFLRLSEYRTLDTASTTFPVKGSLDWRRKLIYALRPMLNKTSVSSNGVIGGSAGITNPSISSYELIRDVATDGHPWAFNLEIKKPPTTANAANILMPNTIACYHEYEVALPLIGLLGAHNDKMFPAFFPTQIRLITESTANFYNTSGNISNFTHTITSCEFVCNYLRLDSGALSAVMDTLPMQGVLPMRCSSFVHSSSLMPKSGLGGTQILVSTRRASMKSLFLGFQASSVLNLVNDPVAPQLLQVESSSTGGYTTSTSYDVRYTEGSKFNSLNPNLGQNCYLTVNGVFYPQQMLNPSNKPMDCLQQFLTTLNMTQMPNLKPSILLQNYLRADFNCNSIFYNPPAICDRSDFNEFPSVCMLGRSKVDADNATNGSNRIIFAHKVQEYRANGVTYSDLMYSSQGETQNAGTIGVTTLYDDKQGLQIGGPRLASVGRNQFYMAIDTEHFGKRGFLSGVSTLGGSCFLNLNVETALSSDYIVRMYNYHDVLLAFNLASGQVEVKI